MHDYDVVMYFYNPNVHPYGEYVRRLGNSQKVGERLGVGVEEGSYDVNGWLKEIECFEEEPEGGRRCKLCFAMRLRGAAEYAKKNGFDCFTTTMTISPHKDSDVINEIGRKLADEFGIEWVHSDFKKKDGFRKSTEMSKDMGLYRQKYCGCFYSVNSSIASPKE
jgi:predicted adenine nucleotide alpha hydrolase (AANH) superfamily ATPase